MSLNFTLTTTLRRLHLPCLPVYLPSCPSHRTITYHHAPSPYARQVQQRVQQQLQQDDLHTSTPPSQLKYEQHLTHKLIQAERAISKQQPSSTGFYCLNSSHTIMQQIQAHQYSHVRMHSHTARLNDCNSAVCDIVCGVLGQSRYRGELYNGGVRIRRVKTSVDMTHCTVYWCVYNHHTNRSMTYSQLDRSAVAAVEQCLAQTIGAVRSRIQRSELNLRTIPIVQYSYDTVYDNAVEKQRELRDVTHSLNVIQNELKLSGT